MEALKEGKIAALLCDPHLPVTVLDTVDSTSSECRRRLAAGESGCLVLAEQQSAGRGRQGKDFFSPPGRGLYLSLLFSPAGGMPAVDGFTAFAAVVVRRAVSAVCGIACGIKWVNDLYLNGRKVCGILTEAVAEKLIVGVGIDLLPGALPEALAAVAGALDSECDRNALAAAIVNGLMQWDPAERGFMEEYRAASIVLGQRIRFLQHGTEREGVAADLTADGRLMIKTEEGLVQLGSGEIRLLRNG